MAKYSKEALDEALLQAQSSDISMKTKGIKFLRQASCLETGTKNTYPIRDWFSETKNYTKLFKIVKSEKDPKLLWEYLFLIKTYCERYIDLAYLVKDSQNFIAKKENTEFKIKACELGELFLVHQDASVRQAAASLLWYLKKTSEVWPVIIELMQKKRDYITLSHIGIMVRNCYLLLNDDKIITDSFENTVAKENLISLKDAEALKEAVSFSLEKTPKAAKKAGFNSVSDTLDDIITILTKLLKDDRINIWRHDKQFGRNSASLFIFEFAFQANIVLLYMCAFRHTFEKTFFANLYLLQKVFIGGKI